MRVLVSAASRHGATSEIADAIGRTLAGAGMEVDVVPPDRVASLDGYDAVVLGSGVYMGRWLEPARTFAHRRTRELAARPLWLFSSGPIGTPPKPDEDPADVPEIAAECRAREHRRFPGRIERSRLGLGERAMASLVRARDGDDRPWTDIEAWAGEIARALTDGSRH